MSDKYIDLYLDSLDEDEEEVAEFDHEISQRKLALAYANANGLPPPRFPLNRFLPGELALAERDFQRQEWERRFTKTKCPHCGYGLTIS